MPGLSCYVGRTEEEANEKYDYQNSLMHPIVAREILSTVLGGVDLSGLRLRRPAAGQSADVEREPEHVQIRHRACQAGQSHHAPDRAGGGRRARQAGRRGHAEADRRPHGGMVRRGGRRRLQHHAAVPAGRARRFRRAGDPGIAAPRPVPHRIHRPHAARASRACRGRRAATPAAPTKRPSSRTSSHDRNAADRARARRRLSGAGALGRGAAALRGRHGDGAARLAHVPRLFQGHRRAARHRAVGRADVRPQGLPARLVLGLLHGADAVHRRALRRARPVHAADGAAAVRADGAVGLRPLASTTASSGTRWASNIPPCGRSACCIS